MRNKINIAELLKNCPKGMELDCTTWFNVTFEKVVNDEIYIKRNNKTPSFNNIIILNQYGCITNHKDEKCRIFPKGKKTWEGFKPPCKFKDGDICCIKVGNRKIGYCENIFIFESINEYDYIKGYVDLHCNSLLTDCCAVCKINDVKEFRFATEEEKQKLFQAIDENGYKWNKKTKTLEEKPTFKDGDILYVDTDNKRDDNCYKYIFIFKEMIKRNKEEMVGNKIISHCYFSDDYLALHETYLLDDIYPIRYATEEEKEKLFDAIKTNGYRWNMETKTLEKLIPKFKIGDKIRYKNGKNINGIEQGVILSITDGTYDVAVTNNIGVYVSIAEQDDWEAIPNKFDIHTLKPFESKVLVRDDGYSLWQPSLWGFYDKEHRFPYVTIGCRYRQCIPYKGNEYLLGKADMCKDYYKNW